MRTHDWARTARVVAAIAILGCIPLACGNSSTQGPGPTVNPMYDEGEPLSEEVELPPDKAAGKVGELFWRNLSFGDAPATCDLLTAEMRDELSRYTGLPGRCPLQVLRLNSSLNEDEIIELRIVKVERVTISESGTEAIIEDEDLSIGKGSDNVGASSSSMELEFDDGRWLVSEIG